MTEHQKASKRHAVLQRRLRVAELAAQGRTQLEIANELGVSQPTICADLNEIHAEWRQAAEAETADRVAREIAMIEEIRRAAWQGWARSQQDAERRRVKTTTGPDEDGVEVERTKERRTQSGDSKMLQTALKCSEMILRTLGAFKPKPTPPVNTWDTVLKTLYESQANGDAEDDAARMERRVKEMPAGAEAKAEDEEPGAREEEGARGQGGEEWGEGRTDRCQESAAREENAETATPLGQVSPAAPVSDAEAADPGSCSSRQNGGRRDGGETPTSAAPVSDDEPAAQLPPGTEEPPKVLGADDPEECWLTARRGWHRVATISSGGLANTWPLGRRP